MATNIEKSRNICGAIIAFLGAAIFSIAAATAIFDTLRFLGTSILVPGKVTNLPYGANHPKITFTTKTGEQVSYIQNGFNFDIRVGDAVQIRYLSDAPKSSARLNRIGAIWEGSIGWGILSIGFALCGIHCLLKLRRNPFKENS